jgi:alpha-tubulin suppressor-like RCC1 family protein
MRISYSAILLLLLAGEALALIPLQGVTQIAAGDKHTCVLMSDGGIRCWGHNASGQLGDFTTTTPRTTVQRAANLAAGFASVTAGTSFTCALTTAGAAQCWGFNGNGELGFGFISSRPYPDNVAGLSSGVAEVAAGRHHAPSPQGAP